MNSRLLLFFPQAPLCYPVGGESNRDLSPAAKNCKDLSADLALLLAHHERCGLLSQTLRIVCCIKKSRDTYVPASNAVALLRREAANERTPISIRGPEGIRDVFVPHPDRAVLIGDCGGVVAPTPYAAAGAELSVSGEAVIGQCAEGGNPDCTCAIHVNRGVACAGKQVQSDHAERHYAFALAVDRHRRKQHVLLVGTVNRDVALVDHRSRNRAPTEC